MMRVLKYPYEKTKIYLCDKYHNKLASLELNKGENTLEINRNDTFYKTASERVFYVYDGAGAQEWQDALKRYNFKFLDLQALDSYLYKGSVDSTNAQDISDFCEVYEKNLNAGNAYLKPPFFEYVEKSLLKGIYNVNF